MIGNPEVRRLGETAQYTCIEGHSTDSQNPAANQFVSECLADGTWTDAPGYCSPVTCPLPTDADIVGTFDGLPTVSGQRVEIADFTMPVVYACKNGYTVDGRPAGLGEQRGTCSADGVLIVNPCQPVVCEYENIYHGPQATIVGAERDFIFGESATLQCDPGWEVCAGMSPSLMTRVQGPAEFTVECLGTGLFSAPIICTNINDCVGHSCGAFGTCVDGQEDYSCACLEGFVETVVLGEKICGNINDCNGVQCGAGGTCNDLVSSFECQCSAGHEHEVSEDTSSVCVPKTCALPVFANSEVLAGLTFTFGNYYQVKCMDGFTTDSMRGEDFTLACSADGIAVGMDGSVASIPQCVPKSCSFPPPIPSAVSQPEQREFFFGEIATYGCAGGDAEVVLSCGTFSWELAGGMDSFYTCANSCGQPQRPVNGIRHGLGQVNHPMSAEIGCNEGYTHLSSGAYSAESVQLSQYCRAHGVYQTWGAEVNVDENGRIICIPVQCSRPSPPAFWQWSGDGTFSTASPATLVCEDGYSSNGMPHALTEQSVFCGVDGTSSLLPAPCVAITHRIVGEVTDAVSGALITGASVTITDSSGAEHHLVTSANGLYIRENVMRGVVTILITKDGFTDIEITVDLQHDTEHGMLDAAMNPHLADNSWRVVLTWLVNPRDLDSHVTRHDHGNGAAGTTMNDPGSSRSHLYWRNTWMGSSNWWSRYSLPYATLDRDNVWGNGIPETVTFFNLDVCTFDCHFVYRVWDYCSLDAALADESEALVRLYNSDGLHSTYNIMQNGRQHSGSAIMFGGESLERRWDVFQLDASDSSGVVVQECLEGECPEDNTNPSQNHAFC